MSIFKNNMLYNDFIQNEISTLSYLQGLSTLAKDFSQLYSQAYTTFHFYKSLLRARKIEEIPFEFQCEFDLFIERKNCKIHIHSFVEPNFEQSSYMLAYCTDKGDDSQLLRKFHFDYALPKQNQVPKPIYHLQYGGEKIKGSEIDVEPLFPWFSNPRIFYYPTNLAILLDSVFFEFKEQNMSANKLVERKEWRDLVKRNEEILLNPFYKRINQFFDREHKFDFLLRDFYYGK